MEDGEEVGEKVGEEETLACPIGCVPRGRRGKRKRGFSFFAFSSLFLSVSPLLCPYLATTLCLNSAGGCVIVSLC